MQGIIFLFFIFLFVEGKANHLLIPMDDVQTNHLKAYGVAYHALKNGYEIQWLINYRGGAFVLPFTPEGRTECLLGSLLKSYLRPG